MVLKLRPEGEKVAFRVESLNADLCEVEFFGGIFEEVS